MRFAGDYEPREDGLRDRPLADLLRDLVQEGQGLLREEVRLAKAEIRAEAKKATKGAAELGAGGAVLYAALLLLGVALILLGDLFLPAWAAALIVTAIYAIAGLVLLGRGKEDLRRADPARAVENVKEDARWVKETMRDIRSSRSANA
jgi:VIT1/CCC1 family predicted Fe2+/Mn2+ transporter